MPTTSPVTQNAVNPQAAANTSSGAPKAPNPVATGATSANANPPASTEGNQVRISAAALAALKEARETPAQTASEARHGDPAARAILAKQAARAAEFKANSK